MKSPTKMPTLAPQEESNRSNDKLEMLRLPTAVIFQITLSTQSHLEVHYENNYQNDRRPLRILSPEEEQQREPKLSGLIKF